MANYFILFAHQCIMIRPASNRLEQFLKEVFFFLHTMYWLILGDTDKIIVIFGRIILRSFSPLMEKHVLPFYQSVISAKKMKGADSGGNKHVFHRRQHFNEKKPGLIYNTYICSTFRRASSQADLIQIYFLLKHMRKRKEKRGRGRGKR